MTDPREPESARRRRLRRGWGRDLSDSGDGRRSRTVAARRWRVCPNEETASSPALASTSSGPADSTVRRAGRGGRRRAVRGSSPPRPRPSGTLRGAVRRRWLPGPAGPSPAIGRGRRRASVGDAVGNTAPGGRARGVAGGTASGGLPVPAGSPRGVGSDLPHGRPARRPGPARSGDNLGDSAGEGSWGSSRPDPHHHPGGQSPLPRLGVWQPAPGDASPGTGHHRPGAGRMRAPLPTTRCYQWLRPTLVSSG